MSAPSIRYLLLAAIIGLCGLSGCITNTKLRGLSVELVGVSATPAPDGGADVQLNFRYINENNVAIAISTARHRVALGSVSLGRVENPRAIGLPRLSSQEQEATVRVDAATAARLRELQRGGSADYQVDTTIIVEAATDKLESRTTASGTVDLSQLNL